MSAMPLQAKKPPFEKDLIKTHILQDVKPSSTKTQNTTERKKTPAPKDRTWSDNMYGGWSRYDVYGDFLDIFGFDIEDPTYIYELATSSFLLENNHYICAAAWDGKQVQFISEIYYPSYDVFTIGYRGTLDPMTGEMQLLSNSGYASQETGNISSLTYDKVSGKLFGLNLNGVLYEVSMQDSTSSVIDTIRWQGQSIGYPMTLSASPNGSLFTISSAGFLYKIDKNTAEGSLVGSVGGTAVELSYQSATFDAVSGTLYWARVIGGDKIDLYTVDTVNGTATFYSDFGLQTIGLFHQYYENAEDVQPSKVENLKIEASGMNIQLSWTNPSENTLGMPMDDMDINIYKATGMGAYSLLATLEDRKAGQADSYQYTENQEGYYRYAVEVVNSHNLKSYLAEADYGLFSYKLPYSTGFEVSDNNIPLVPDSTVQFVTDADLVHSGQRSALIPQYSRLRFAGMPFEKGSTYRISFTAKGYEGGMENENPAFVIKPFATLNVRFDGEEKVYYPEETRSLDWADATVDFYVEKSGRHTWAFTTSVFDVYYVDDVKVELLVPNTTPAKVTQAYVENEGTSLDAHLYWTNPVITAGDEALSEMKDVIVQVSPYNNFDAESIVLSDTVPTTEIGGEMQKTYTMPYPKSWYFRLIARNSVGMSPMDTIIQSRWIGRDTVIDYPENLQATNIGDGKIQLTWDRLPDQGANGGDLDGTITGYRVIRMDGNGESVSEQIVADTVYVSEPLPMNFYTFSVNGIRNNLYDGDSNQIRLIGGLRDGQTVIEDIDYNAGFSEAPFNVATEFSNQSTVNQIIYPRQAFKEPCFIDTLYFLMEAPALSVSQKFRIHLGTYPKESFGYYELDDWAAIDSLSEAFAGNLRLEKGKAILKIPVKPFYYDHQENLLLSVIRGKQAAMMDVLFINNQYYEGYRQVHDYHTENLSDYYELSGKPVLMTPMQIAPVLVVNRIQNLNTLQGEVRSLNGEPIAGARIAVESQNMETANIAFSQTLESDTAGYFSFLYFPDNEYSIRLYKEGFQDIDTIFTLSGGQTVVWNPVMEASSKVSITGKVINRQQEAVAEAKVSLAENTNLNTLTDHQGNFRIDSAYGATRYSLLVEHDFYQPYQATISIGMDSINPVEPVQLTYYPFPVRLPKVSMSDGQPIVSWQKPLASSKNTERKYYNEEDGAICSSSELSIGIKFTKTQLKSWYEKELALTGLSFHSNDTTAFYSVEIYSGDMENPIHTQAAGYLPNGYHRIFLDKALPIDTTQDLLVAMHADGGYAGCPFSKDKGPQLNSGALINQGDGWKLMSDYMIDGEGYNWILSATFGFEQERDAANGYRIYRAKDEGHLFHWEELGKVEANTFSYADKSWSGLGFGDYVYAIRSDWHDNNLSDNRISSRIGKDMDFSVKIIVEDPQERINGKVTIHLSSIDGVSRYTQTLSENLETVFDSVRRNTYRIEASGNGVSGKLENVAISSDTTLTVTVTSTGIEMTDGPSGLRISPNPSSNGHFTIHAPGWTGADLKIFSLDGKLVHTRKVTESCFKLNLNNRDSNAYLLQISKDGQTEIVKLIIG